MNYDEEKVTEEQKNSVSNDNHKTNIEDNNSGKENNNRNTLDSNELNGNIKRLHLKKWKKKRYVLMMILVTKVF